MALALLPLNSQRRKRTLHVTAYNFSDKRLVYCLSAGTFAGATARLQMQHVLRNVSPAVALSVGLKVDSDALPQAVLSVLAAGQWISMILPSRSCPMLDLPHIAGIHRRSEWTHFAVSLRDA